MNISGIVAERIAEITERVAPASVDAEINFGGLDLHVKAGLFDPSRGRSTKKMVEAIRLAPPAANDRFIEIGTGTGVLSIFVEQNYHLADMTALDIMPAAVACARENFQRHKLPRIKCGISDLFKAVSPPVLLNKKYDYVIFNAPTSHPTIAADNPGAVTLWDINGSIKCQFIEQAREITSEKGKILMMYSRYADFDPLAGIDFSGFEQSYMLVSRDDISEAGVLLLTKQRPAP